MAREWVNAAHQDLQAIVGAKISRLKKMLANSGSFSSIYLTPALCMLFIITESFTDVATIHYSEMSGGYCTSTCYNYIQHGL